MNKITKHFKDNGLQVTNLCTYNPTLQKKKKKTNSIKLHGHDFHEQQ